MTDKEKVLTFLRDHDGSATKTQIFLDIFKGGRSASQLADLLSTELAGLVTQKKSYAKKNKPQVWKLTPAGWATANQIVNEKPPETQQEPVSDGFARFKRIAAENPDASPQRLLQLAGRHVGDPLGWPQAWRDAHPEWYLKQPREWYTADVELDSDGYPQRYPENPVAPTGRPNTDRGWFDRAMGMAGASLEPLACEMPAYECANVIRVARKVGQKLAEEIFGPDKIATANRLAGLANSEATANT